MPNDIVAQAARNNALWCDAVASTHNGAGEFRDDLWINSLGVPRYYPDVVTLIGAEAAPAQTSTISALVRQSPRRAWAVKDSFRSLDLAPLGFAPLFDANWFCASPEAPGAADHEMQWRRVDDEPALLDWEKSWSDAPVEASARIFKPSLLSEPGIHVLSALERGAFVGGGVLNLGAGVVGISNLFARGSDLTALWLALAHAARSTFRGLPIVAYEHREEDLQAACRAGFSSIGALRVWNRAEVAENRSG
jgi:hypothetical protein